MEYVLTLTLFAVAVSSSLCAHLTRPGRNYYPMQRVIWAVLGFLYGGGALQALLTGGERPESAMAVRVVFNLVVLGVTLYSVAFMRRRNRAP